MPAMGARPPGRTPDRGPRRPRVQNGYISPGTGGYARPLVALKNRSVSGGNVPARAREWMPVPHLSFPRNEGVPGSSPGVGLKVPAQKPLVFSIWETHEVL